MSNEFKADMPRRALRCKSWSWTPGMLAMDFMSEGNNEIDTAYYKRLDDSTEEGMRVSPAALPVITDHATRGCMLGLIQRAAGNETVSLQCLVKANGSIEWSVTGVADGRRFFIGDGSTMENALISALETTGNSNGRR